MGLKPIKISYVAKSRILGGYNLERLFGKENGGENIGETWELTVRNDENSVILEGEGSIVCGGKEYPIRPGDSYFLPAALGRLTAKGKMEIIVSSL